MAFFNCSCKRDCTLFAVIVSLILGIIGAFLQITAVITVTPVFLIVTLGIAVVYLAVLLVTAVLSRRMERRCCPCDALDTALVGVLATILFSVILLAVGIVATSVVSAILIGLLTAAVTLAFAGTACLVRCLADCGD